ncbi:hypothetical protein ACUX1R_25165, partial [Salmonella enterica]
ASGCGAPSKSGRGIVPNRVNLCAFFNFEPRGGMDLLGIYSGILSSEQALRRQGEVLACAV